MNVDKMHGARHEVLVTVICSKTFVVGALQKCVFYRSAGPYIWDFCFHLLPVRSNMHRPHNSGFLVSPLCSSPSKVQSISARLYISWSGILESEYIYAVDHRKINVTLQYRF